MLRLHSIETFGTHDGPGIRLVLFTQGCPLRCVYCHNPDTQALETAESREYSTAQLLALLEKQRPYFGQTGGLTVSGGEPTVQAEGVIELFTAAKAAGFHLALDTSGVIFNPTVNQLYDLTDLVILDVKHINDAWHRKVTSGSVVPVLKNAAYREQSGKELWLRYVLVPGWTDQPEFVEEWARHFQAMKTVSRVEILPYHTLGVYKYEALCRPYGLTAVQPPSAAQVNQVKTLMEKYLPQVIVA